MSRVSLRLLVALITFTLGIVATAVWLTRKVPELQAPAVTKSQCFPGKADKIDAVRVVADRYFPDGVFYKDEKRDRFVSGWYSRNLRMMNEAPLLTSHHDHDRSYRFLWLRSFHPSVVVRLWANGEKYMLSVKELSLRDQNKPNQLLTDQTRILSNDEWAGFVKQLDETCFWEIPTTTNDPIAMDGARWVLEGIQQGYYHIATRQSPDSGSYRELCLYMLKLSALPLDPSKGEIY